MKITQKPKLWQILGILGFLLIVLIVWQWQGLNWQKRETAPELTEPTPTVQESYFFETEEDGQKAFDLIGKQVQLQTKSYSFGEMVEGVNGLLADEHHFWAIFVNGQLATSGLADLDLKKGDRIELRYETLSQE